MANDDGRHSSHDQDLVDGDMETAGTNYRRLNSGDDGSSSTSDDAISFSLDEERLETTSWRRCLNSIVALQDITIFCTQEGLRNLKPFIIKYYDGLQDVGKPGASSICTKQDADPTSMPFMDANNQEDANAHFSGDIQKYYSNTLTFYPVRGDEWSHCYYPLPTGTGESSRNFYWDWFCTLTGQL